MNNWARDVLLSPLALGLLRCSLYKRNLTNGEDLLIWELLMLLLFQWVLHSLAYLILIWFQEIGICLLLTLKIVFFTIPLHPGDQPGFTFSVPSINLKEPHKRFQWTVLPQGMLNSPSICQNFAPSTAMIPSCMYYSLYGWYIMCLT